MQTKSISRFLLIAGLAGSTLPADTTLKGPVLGYVLDGRSQAIRPVNGIPGAAHVGTPLALPFAVARAAFSSNGDFALVVAAEAEDLLLVRNLEAPVVSRLAGAIWPERMVLNGDNSAALLYTSEPRRLQVVRGLPNNPVAGPMLDLSSLTGTVTALALDREGREALLALSDNGRGTLARVPVPDEGEASDLRSVEPRSLGVFGSLTAVALLNRDRDAVVTDGATNQLFLIRDFTGEAAIEALASERDGIANPVGVEASLDGRRVFVANGAEPGGVLVVDLASRTVEVRATPEGAPSRMERLQGRTAFLLNELGDAPLLVLDNVENPEVYFVPAGREN